MIAIAIKKNNLQQARDEIYDEKYQDERVEDLEAHAWTQCRPLF